MKENDLPMTSVPVFNNAVTQAFLLATATATVFRCLLSNNPSSQVMGLTAHDIAHERQPVLHEPKGSVYKGLSA